MSDDLRQGPAPPSRASGGQPKANISISKAELKDPSIDLAIEHERALQRPAGEFVEDVKTPFYLNPAFYYPLGGLLTALLVWALVEPHVDDTTRPDELAFVGNYVFFGPVAAAISLAIGATYGLANRNLRQALYCAVVGLGVGLGATIVTTFIAQTVYAAGVGIAVAFLKEDSLSFTGFPFYVHTCARGLAWSVVSLGAGLGLGTALQSRKLALNGVAGGMVGGLIGGLLFDPIGRFLTGDDGDGSISRGVGTVAIGVFVGFFIGFFENISRDSWLLLQRGTLAGKQFILFKSPMIIGSSPKSDIYLFKDPSIEPRHASVTLSGNKYVLKHEGLAGETRINGRSIERSVLQPGDAIEIGEALLKYQERERS